MYVYIPFFCFVLHNAIFRKDYTILVGRLHPFNPFFEDSSIKIGRDIGCNGKLRAFVVCIPEVRQQQHKEFVDTLLFRCKKIAFDTITRNNFLAAST